MLVGMLHSTLIAPSQSMLQDVYGYNKNKKNTYRNYGNSTPTKNNLEQNTSIKPTIHYNPQSKKVDTIINPLKLENFIISADINQGIIGISTINPLDDAKDNLFKFYIQDFEKQKYKAYLTYELFGVQNSLAVSRSINDRPSTGGHIIKEQKGWTTQREEIDVNWLQIGENKILFTIPEGANYEYQVKNIKLEFSIEDKINSSLIVTNSNLNYVKDNSLYVKGFVKKP